MEKVLCYQSFVTAICLFSILASRRFCYTSAKCSSRVILTVLCCGCGIRAAYTLIAMFTGPTWGPSGADRTQMGPCWPHKCCYLGSYSDVFVRCRAPYHILNKIKYHNESRLIVFCKTSLQGAHALICISGVCTFVFPGRLLVSLHFCTLPFWLACGSIETK